MKKLIIFISLETYLRNWIASGAFTEIEKYYKTLYVLPEYDWDSTKIEKYGIENYVVIKQGRWRMFLYRKLLLITMIRFSKKSYAFRVKTSSFRNNIIKLIYYTLSKNILFKLFLEICRKILGKWYELDIIFNEFKPNLIIAPSLAADSFTIDMTLTAELSNIESILLINSWDNLVSKGVIPIKPSYIGLWGEQSINHAVNIQNIPIEKLKILGVPRFDAYFYDNNEINVDIYKINKIPTDKKIILYPSTVLPFNDIEALQILDKEITDNPLYRDYIILFRSHPEMMHRKNEISVLEAGFNNIYLDIQTSEFYLSRFGSDVGKDYGSTLNETSLEYYPSLLKNVVALVCPATTMSLEGLLNGKPCMMLCYDDGMGYKLSAKKVAKFENVQEILNMKGVYPVYEKKDILIEFKKIIMLLSSNTHEKDIIVSTKYFVYRDKDKYSIRLKNFIDEII